MTTATATKMIAVPDDVPAHDVTLAEIDDQIASVQSAITRWNQDGQGTPLGVAFPVPQYLISCVDQLARLTSTVGELPHERHKFVLAFDEFYAAFSKWRDNPRERELNPEATGVWRLWSEAVRRMEPDRPAPPPESPHEICRVAHVALNRFLIGRIDGNLINTAAKIHGWRDEAGRLDANKVCEELAAPGTHYKPGEWVDAKYERRQAELANQMAERAVRVMLEARNARAKR